MSAGRLVSTDELMAVARKAMRDEMEWHVNGPKHPHMTAEQADALVDATVTPELIQACMFVPGAKVVPTGRRKEKP